MNINILVFLAAVYFSCCEMPTYDEDIAIPGASTIIGDTLSKKLRMQIIANVSNCIFSESKGNFISCTGTNCLKFPANVTIITTLFKVKLTSIKVLKRNDFLGLEYLKQLEIEANSYLDTIEPGLFKNFSKLQNLTISSNVFLKQLHEKVFEGLVNLEQLLLLKNGFNNILDVTRALSAQFLPKLDLLNLAENSFNKIHANDFKPMNESNLVQLNLYLCQIEYIHPDCLKPLRNLNVLRLGQNIYTVKVLTRFLNRTINLGVPLTFINLFQSGLRMNTISPVLKVIAESNISTLHLAQNHFEHIGRNMFPYMPNLTFLDLRRGVVSDIAPNAFKKLPNLKVLYLGENLLMGIPQGILVPTLIELDLADNSNIMQSSSSSFFNIENKVFQNMSQLRILQLSYNNIGFLSRSTFIGLSNLTKLNLKNTFLNEIEPGTFSPLKKLKHLNLINNPFPKVSSLTPDIFLGLDQLEILLMSGCSIENLDNSPSLFKYTPKLIHLGLEQNQIHLISPDQFQHLSNLQTLDLSKNKLSSWTEKLLPSNLKQLSLSKNKFTYVNLTMLDDWKDLDYIYLSGNLFSCDCTLYPVKQGFKSDRFPITEGGCCSFPYKWRNITVLHYLINFIEDECASMWILNKVTLTAILIFFIVIALASLLLYIYRQQVQYLIFLVRIKFNTPQISNPNNFVYDAFVSYCNEDRQFVMNMVDLLENSEPFLKLCVYERDFQIGSSISEAVVESLIASKKTVLVVSNAFAKSQWCRWETQLAEFHQIFFRSHRKDGQDDTLIMVRLDVINKEYVTPILKYLMKTRIYLEWNSDVRKQDLFWEKLRTALASSKQKLPTLS